MSTTPTVTLAGLEAARPALLRLHAALLAAERDERERVGGTIPGGAWLTAVLEDASLAWLRPLSRLVADLDEAMAEAVRLEAPLGPAELAAFERRARACVTPCARYLELLQDSPEVVLAHRDAVRALPPAPPRGG